MSFYLKATRTGRAGTHATGFVWPEHGTWYQVPPGPLRACAHGIHVCRPDQIVGWLSDELHVIEVCDRFKVVTEADKVVVRRARLVRQLSWDDRVARGFAADCAERVLHLFEAERPGDDRPRKAIAAARAYAHGEIDAAAWAAARAAAWAAAGAAAGVAARAAAGAAAGAAARAAARDAAWAAARDAARAAEMEWQTAHLMSLIGADEVIP